VHVIKQPTHLALGFSIAIAGILFIILVTLILKYRKLIAQSKKIVALPDTGMNTEIRE
jgi:hypothetical protein